MDTSNAEHLSLAAAVGAPVSGYIPNVGVCLNPDPMHQMGFRVEGRYGKVDSIGSRGPDIWGFDGFRIYP